MSAVLYQRASCWVILSFVSCSPSQGRAHGELLAWFFQRYPDAGERALYRWVETSPDPTHWVTSEFAGSDLVAKVPGRVPCIIHCSVFDPPNTDRIERAAKSKPAGQPGQQLVLSSVDPGWDNDTYWTSSGSTARWIDYRLFLTALNGAASTIEGDGFDRHLIERYCASMTATVIGLAELDLKDPHEPIEIEEMYVEQELRCSSSMALLLAAECIEPAPCSKRCPNMGNEPTSTS